jgi:transcriptional regulator with XRE-family HTH domain
MFVKIFLDLALYFVYNGATMKINTKKMEKERKAMGLGKMAFSRKCGMTASTYGKILQSKSTTLKTLTTIADLLNVDPKDLLI